jgi:hypothetical protein
MPALTTSAAIGLMRPWPQSHQAAGAGRARRPGRWRGAKSAPWNGGCIDSSANLLVANQNLSRVRAVSPDVLDTLLANVATLAGLAPLRDRLRRPLTLELSATPPDKQRTGKNGLPLCLRVDGAEGELYRTVLSHALDRGRRATVAGRALVAVRLATPSVPASEHAAPGREGRHRVRRQAAATDS